MIEYMRSIGPRIPAAVLALLLAGAALAQGGPARSDAAREKRWADQILPNLVVGDAVQLQGAEGRFLALYAKAEPARGAVLLAHGSGLHPDHGITGELRVHLADRGYTTLSLQMPVLPAEVDDGSAYRALFPEAAGRIAAGMQYLQERGEKRIFIVSHAMGTGMTHAYLRANRGAPVAGWAALSFYGVFDGITGAAFPVLDLFGARDYRGIRNPARDRAEILRALPNSKQLAVPEGGFFLTGGEKTVLQEVTAFLEALSAR